MEAETNTEGKKFMEKKTIIMIAIGIAVALIIANLFSLIKQTPSIWVVTRIFGLISYAFLLATVLLGELRMLSKVKGDFSLFRLHKPIAISSIFLVAVHGLAAVFDKYKWGKGLTLIDFSGFNFSGKWLVLLSIGVLSFYIMLIVGATSSRKGMQTLGFKRWKLVHYLSYVSFITAYVHAINLGTDIKSGMLADLLFPFFKLSFLIVMALLITRMINGFGAFSDQWEINLGASFVILLIMISTFFISSIAEKQQEIKAMNLDLLKSQREMQYFEDYNLRLVNQSSLIRQQIGIMENG